MDMHESQHCLSREGGNPCWIPAFAGMTSLPACASLAFRFVAGFNDGDSPPIEASAMLLELFTSSHTPPNQRVSHRQHS